MTKGNGLYILLILISIAAFTLDNSTEPMLSLLANGWEIALVFLGVWKMLELFNKLGKGK